MRNMDRKINLFHVAYDLKIGGGQVLVKTLALNTNRERYNVTVVTLSNNREDPESDVLIPEIRSAGVEVINLKMRDWEHTEPREYLIGLMKDRKVDVVHSHLYPIDIWGSRAAKLAGVPAILYTKHETYKKRLLKERISRAIQYNTYVDLALSISRLTKRHMIFYEMIPPWKIRTVPNPVDDEYYDPAKFSGTGIRNEFGIPAGAPVVADICRLVGRKGLGSFVETCHRVSKAVPECYFLLVGDGYKMNDLKTQVSSLGIKNFIFTGTRRDIGEVLAAVDIFLFTPYWGEALPLAMLESMSMGKAIVASNVCSNNELLKHGVSGLLPSPKKWKKGVESLDADAMAEAVISLIRDPQMRLRYGKEARRTAITKYGLKPIMRKLESIYEELLHRKGVI